MEEYKSAARRLLETRTARDEAKRALESAEAEFRECEADFFELLDDNIEGTLKLPLGEPWGTVAFRNRETIFGRIIDDDAAIEWAANNALLDEVSAPKFVKRRINEIVRDHREQGLDMPPGLDFYTQTGVTITRQKG